MNKIKLLKSNTTAIVVIKAIVKDLKFDVDKFANHVNSRTLTEKLISKDSILNSYGILVKKHSDCRASLLIYFQEQQDINIELDFDRASGSKKVSRKQEKINLAKEEFVLAYKDTDSLLNKISLTFQKVNETIKALISGALLDEYLSKKQKEGGNAGKKSPKHTTKEILDLIDCPSTTAPTTSRLDSNFIADNSVSRLDNNPEMPKQSSRLDSTIVNPNGDGK